MKGPAKGTSIRPRLALVTHSTQSTPAMILEVRRIPYEHLGIASGLECEVPERVDAAVASAAERAEPPAVSRNGVQEP